MEDSALRESDMDSLIRFTSQSNSDEYIAFASASRPAAAWSTRPSDGQPHDALRVIK
jgi:hypothetical protein